MKKDLQTLVSVYTRYLDSLKVEGADIKENYSKMREFINENCEEWLKGHMLQDCYINCLRAYHKKLSSIEASMVINELVKTHCCKNSMNHCKFILTLVTKDDNGDKHIEYRTSWLPTLYMYFRPSNEEELDYMTSELERMNDNGLVSPSDYFSVKSLILDAVRTSKHYINEESVNKKPLVFQVVDGDKVLKEIEQEELEEALTEAL